MECPHYTTLCLRRTKIALPKTGRAINFQENLLNRESRAEFIAINNQASLIAIVPHLARDHFDRHADFNVVVIHVSQLRGDHGTFVQFDERYGVRRVAVIAAGRFVDGGVGIHLAFAAECVEFLGFVAAVRADITRGEYFVIAVRTDLADQSVALFFESPVSWDFHDVVSFL